MAGWTPMRMSRGMMTEPTAAATPAALGREMLTKKVTKVAPGTRMRRTLYRGFDTAFERCRSQPVYFMTKAKAMTEQILQMRLDSVMPLVSPLKAAMGARAATAMMKPAAIRTRRDSTFLIMATMVRMMINSPK